MLMDSHQPCFLQEASLSTPILLDCTLRDGGYYNSWDFPVDLINDYLEAWLHFLSE